MPRKVLDMSLARVRLALPRQKFRLRRYFAAFSKKTRVNRGSCQEHRGINVIFFHVYFPLKLEQSRFFHLLGKKSWSLLNMKSEF